MTDIHTHILPFVDDGSISIETSVEMLKRQQKNGIDTVVLTPHYCVERKYMKTAEEIRSVFNNFKEEAQKAGVSVRLLLGQEICYTQIVDVLDLLRKGELLTINGSNYVLLEFSFTERPESVSDVIYSFRISGYNVIVAHVERYKWINLKTVESMREQGALIQVNSNSIVGRSGLKIKFFAKNLIKRGLVDFVASDVHSFRPSTLARAREILKTDAYFNGLPDFLK